MLLDIEVLSNKCNNMESSVQQLSLNYQKIINSYPFHRVELSHSQQKTLNKLANKSNSILVQTIEQYHEFQYANQYAGPKYKYLVQQQSALRNQIKDLKQGSSLKLIIQKRFEKKKAEISWLEQQIRRERVLYNKQLKNYTNAIEQDSWVEQGMIRLERAYNQVESERLAMTSYQKDHIKIRNLQTKYQKLRNQKNNLLKDITKAQHHYQYKIEQKIQQLAKDQQQIMEVTSRLQKTLHKVDLQTQIIKQILARQLIQQDIAPSLYQDQQHYLYNFNNPLTPYSISQPHSVSMNNGHNTQIQNLLKSEHLTYQFQQQIHLGKKNTNKKSNSIHHATPKSIKQVNSTLKQHNKRQLINQKKFPEINSSPCLVLKSDPIQTLFSAEVTMANKNFMKKHGTFHTEQRQKISSKQKLKCTRNYLRSRSLQKNAIDFLDEEKKRELQQHAVRHQSQAIEASDRMKKLESRMRVRYSRDNKTELSHKIANNKFNYDHFGIKKTWANQETYKTQEILNAEKYLACKRQDIDTKAAVSSYADPVQSRETAKLQGEEERLFNASIKNRQPKLKGGKNMGKGPNVARQSLGASEQDSEQLKDEYKCVLFNEVIMECPFLENLKTIYTTRQNQ